MSAMERWLYGPPTPRPTGDTGAMAAAKARVAQELADRRVEQRRTEDREEADALAYLTATSQTDAFRTWLALRAQATAPGIERGAA